ncbi:MAG: tetratricopeptide repeat protein, partial [Bacteroidota bacterium]|nr:tetratricopeptide repeat protein [Bacteroidota bacterium]
MRKFKKNNIKLFFKLISPLIIFLAYLTLPYMLSDIAAKYCINKGAYLKAENIYWKSLSVRQKLDPMEPLAIIDDYRNLADLYIKEKKFDLAQFCFEQIIGLYEGEGHYDLTVDDLISLGSICWAKKDYKNTENYYLEAIKRAEKYFGKYDHRTYELEL